MFSLITQLIIINHIHFLLMKCQDRNIKFSFSYIIFRIRTERQQNSMQKQNIVNLKKYSIASDQIAKIKSIYDILYTKSVESIYKESIYYIISYNIYDIIYYISYLLYIYIYNYI